MKYAFYYDLQTKLVSTVSSGPDGIEFEEPAQGYGVVFCETAFSLPAYWDGEQVLPLPPQPSPAHEWSGDVKAWVLNQALLPQALAEQQTNAQAQIDSAAGRARLRYITDVPGQQATYQRKEQQARDWVESGHAGPAPSFIAAEAAALGVTPEAIAQQVIALADFWADIKGPEIEACRIKWKAAVRAADALDAVASALDQALSELEAL